MNRSSALLQALLLGVAYWAQGFSAQAWTGTYPDCRNDYGATVCDKPYEYFECSFDLYGSKDWTGADPERNNCQGTNGVVCTKNYDTGLVNCSGPTIGSVNCDSNDYSGSDACTPAQNDKVICASQPTLFGITMYCRQAGAILRISDTTHDFKDWLLNTAGDTYQFSLERDKEDPHPLPLDAVISGQSSFSILSNDCPAELGKGDICNVTVKFTPAVTGPQSAVLKVNSLAINNPVQANVTANVDTTARYALNHVNKLEFENTPVGFANASSLTLSNDGNAPIQILEVNSELADFQVDAGDCLKTIQPHEFCRLFVNFAPQSESILSGLLKIKSDVLDEHSVTLTGTGVRAVFNLSSNIASFNFWPTLAGHLSDLKFNLFNDGNVPVSIKNMAIEGDGFTLFPDECTTTGPLAANAQCTVTVRFKPTEPNMNYSAKIQVDSTAANSPLNIFLNGASMGHKPECTAEPEVFQLGRITAGQSVEHDVLVRNTGVDRFAYEWPSVSIGEHLELVSSSCGQVVEPSGTCVVRVRYNSSQQKPGQINLGKILTGVSLPCMKHPATIKAYVVPPRCEK